LVVDFSLGKDSDWHISWDFGCWCWNYFSVGGLGADSRTKPLKFRIELCWRTWCDSWRDQILDLQLCGETVVRSPQINKNIFSTNLFFKHEFFINFFGLRNGSQFNVNW
jgi:hypothetical protein